MNRIRRTGSSAAATLAAIAALAPAAQAACPPVAASPVFAPFGDTNLYTLFPGGSFEAGAPGWALTGPAAVVADNEPFRVHGAGDASALQLGPGASATTPPVCIGTGDRLARLFARNPAGPRGATLQVEALYSGRAASRKHVANLNGGAAWQVTSELNLVRGALKRSAIDGDVRVQLRFTTLRGASWRIDDVYVDPRYRG
jgi:hypothetical protein